MAVIVQSCFNSVASGTTVTATFPNPTTPGNMLVACVTCLAWNLLPLGGVVDNYGNTWTDAIPGGRVGLIMGVNQQYAKNIAGGSSATVTLTLVSTSSACLAVYEVYGVNFAAPVDKYDSVSNPYSLPTTTAVGYPWIADFTGLAIMTGLDDGVITSNTFTITSPWIQDYNQSHSGSTCGFISGHRTTFIGNTYPAGFSMGTADGWALQNTLFRDVPPPFPTSVLMSQSVC